MTYLDHALRVLYVGESRENCTAVIRAFDRPGFDVAKACCYREAMSSISRNTFVLVFCEQHLPDGRWVDLLGRFAEMNDPPPLILLTQNTKSWAEAINLGAQDVLLIPISDRELRHVADSVLQSRVLHIST